MVNLIFLYVSFFIYVAVSSVISGGAISVENSQNPEERRKGLHLVRLKLWQERYLTLVSDGLIPPTKKETHLVGWAPGSLILLISERKENPLMIAARWALFNLYSEKNILCLSPNSVLRLPLWSIINSQS